MPVTATVSTSGRIVVQFAARSRLASSICQNPSATQSKRKEPREPQASAIRMGRRPPARSAAKLMAGREHDAGEGRRGEKQRNLVGVEVAPVQPDRQIRKVAATDQEDSSVKEAEPPGAGRRCGARFNLLGQIL